VAELQTCPKCGALITRELERCRRCKTYLHGTQLEGALLQHLLPESMRGAPGTASLALITIVYYVMMVVLSAPVDHGSLLGFSHFSLIQLGATSGTRQLLGEHWRYVTSILAHHDLMHLAFNLWALSSAGPLVEELFDRKKMMILYLLSGVASMIVSFVWYVFVLGQIEFVSAGASGAVSGLIGAALFGARRRGSEGREVVSGMTRWSIYMVAWGFMMGGINNAAHLGGWVVGGLIAHFMPLGLARSTVAQRGLSVAVLGVLAVAIASTAMMLVTLRGFPASLALDPYPRRMFGMTYAPGMDWEGSDLPAIFARCTAHLESSATPSEEAIHDCELNTRVNDGFASFALHAQLLARAGQLEEAQRYAAVAEQFKAAR